MIQRLSVPRRGSFVVVALVVAVLVGWPAAASAVQAPRSLSRSEVRAAHAYVTWLAPQLGRYERELSSVQAQVARAEAPTPLEPFGTPIAFGPYRASEAASSTPASVSALRSTIGGLAGRARRALSDLVTEIKDGAFTNPGGIASAASQIAGLLNPAKVPMKKLKRDAAALIQQLASVLPPFSLAVGPGQPTGSCPRSEDSIDCWILQDTNGETLSNWLGGANVVASIVGMIAGVGEIPSLGSDTPLTILSDVAGTGTSVAQFYVDLVRRAGYSDSVVNKVVTVFLDGVSVGTSVFDLGLLADMGRLKAASEVVDKVAPTLEEVIGALHNVIPAGEDVEKGVKLVDLIAKLRDANTVLEAKTQAKTIVSVLLSIFTAYNGPEASWLHRLARYLAQRGRAALGSTVPSHHSAEVYFLASNSSGGFDSGGGSSKPVYLVRPMQLAPMGSNPPSAEKLNSWNHWGASSTSSQGTLGYDTCSPDCASAYRFTSGSAKLSGVRSCGPRLEYTELRFVYFKDPKEDVTFTLSCEGQITSYK